MNKSIESRLNSLVRAGQQHLLRGGRKGLEKESLRITSRGQIARTPHPAALGSALTHPYITTDYSEALIELITPPFEDAADTLKFLGDLHRFVYDHLADEFLLATSMPCEIENDESIPIAVYGRSNIGKMKHVYRRGLAYRYGRAMQAIAGIHFNYSVNEAFWPVYQNLVGNQQPLDQFIADQYFGLIRNIQRHGWLILYLFGSSPALCRSFFASREHLPAGFLQFDARTLYRPYATSLRMSDIGYRNDSQAGLDISFNNLEEYVASLSRAIETPYAEYEKIGVKVEGEYRQLNANILQIENEYYSSIRPKQVAGSGEKPTLALQRRGLRYIELRSVDLGCFKPVGIDLSQMHFLELFLLCCLLVESSPLDAAEKRRASQNSLAVACCGRTPGFRLQRDGRQVGLREWALELMESMRAVAEVLDQGQDGRPYVASVDGLFDAILDPQNTPSAHVLSEMRERSEPFADFALRLSRQHAADFRARPPDVEREAEFRREADRSWQEQERIEAGDTCDFDEFLRRYFAQT